MNNGEIKYYPTTVPQDCCIIAEDLTGKVYNNLCIMINYEQDDIDPAMLEDAVNKAILRFPSSYLRRHDFKEGKKKVVKQYFVESPGSMCQVVSFDSDKKMYKYIDKFVKKPFPNGYQDCDLYRINLVKRANGRYSVLVCIYHLIADAYAIIMLLNDVNNIYMALNHNTEMPKPFEPLLPAYQDVWDYEKSSKHDKDVEFWKEFWDSVTLPQFATINGFHDRYAYIPGKKYGNYLNIFNFKAVQVNYKLSRELNERVNALAENLSISPKIIYMLAIRTYLSKQTEKTEELIIADLLANRSKKCIANTSGSFAEMKSFYFDAKNNMTFIEACKHTSSCQYKYYMHNKLSPSEINAELVKNMNIDKMFDKGWVRGTSAILFTYQPYFSANDNELTLSVERFTTGKSPMPMYITVMPTDTYTGEMNINYEYVTKLHTAEDVEKFHQFIVSFLDKATNNPELTLDELMEDR